ncbi:hypothetical protein I316_02915 [Kwoniella heveanensis BCC8398]|uniref:Uncharacterized protein n=1 Tax=Kwoniella heveanensis BCC8398 TaxID=1296120 RepID=A0A1B9GWR8_9TREE|nr:hypothetical protein I316_02915 [Kwoniella heveanensis BCC8398]
MVNFTPSRRAPSPPPSHTSGSAPATTNALPPNHPFATYYIPPQSRSDLTSIRVKPAQSSSPSPSAISYSSTSKSGYASSERSRSSTSPRSPTSSLAQPLTPPRSIQYEYSGSVPSSRSSLSSSSFTSTSSFGSAHRDEDQRPYYSGYTYASLGHHKAYAQHGTGLGQFAPQPLDQSKPRSQHQLRSELHPAAPWTAPHPSLSRYSPPASPAASAYLPTELTLFDHRPKQNLLADVEYIIGKKVSFPFLNAFTKQPKSNSNSAEKTKAKKDKKKKKGTLVKERVVEEGWEF